MTREAINELKKYTSGRKNTEKIEVNVLALNRIILALEQEPYEDAISRQAAINIVGDMHGLARADVLSDAVKQLKELPPVTPQEPILDKIRAEIKALSNANPSHWYSGDMVDRNDVFEIIDEYKAKSKVEELEQEPCTEIKESATVAKFYDFYPEDSATWPPTDKELLVKNQIGDNFIAYLEFDDGEDGGWGFYSEDGEFIADVTEIDAWMPIPQHERDKNYIPIQERKAKGLHIDAPSPEEEKDR